MQLTETAADAAGLLARAAGIDLDKRQISDLRELMYIRATTGTWRWSEWSVLDPRHDERLVDARVLAGFLLLDERVLWSADTHALAAHAFRRLEALLVKLGRPGDGRTIDVSGVQVKVRRANGEEQFERLDTGARIQFISRRHAGAGRGLSVDLHVVDQNYRYTADQHERLLPTMATRPNPQIIYV